MSLKQKFDAVLFDMDGVIVDSEPIYQEFERATYDRYDIPVTEEFIMVSVGRPTLEWWTEVEDTYHRGIDPVKTTQDEEDYYIHFIESGRVAGRVMPGITDTFRKLNDLGLKMAVATGSPKEAIGPVLSCADPDGIIEIGISSTEVEKGKPEPDIFLEAARRLGVDPARCLVIEDSYNGLLAAKAAGMTSVAYLSHPEGMDTSCADYSIEHHPELFEIGLFEDAADESKE